MCGIVGYVGHRQACPVIIKGLHRLEYRGYDSAGVALIGKDGQIGLYKCKGKVDDLERFLDGKATESTIGIGHTRWATHGAPNDANAHPHLSQSGRLALIHNGIIENFRVLKDALTSHGYTFRSSTDSEVLVNLIEYVQDTNRPHGPQASGGRVRHCRCQAGRHGPDYRRAAKLAHGHWHWRRRVFHQFRRRLHH